MAIFNGRDWTFADFSGEDGYKYAENWDLFWPDVLTEMSNRAAAIGAGLIATSVSSVTIGTGSKSFNVGAGKGFVAGMWVTATDVGNSANSLTGSVTSYTSGTGVLVLSVPAGATTGSGTIAAWTLGISGKPGATGPAGPTSTYWGGTAGGTANALMANTGANLSSLTAGLVVGVKIGASVNTSATTLAVDNIPPVAIRKDGSALAGGELAAGTYRYFMSDGTYWTLMGGAGTGGAFSDIVPVTGAGTIGASAMGKLVKATGGPYTVTFASAATLGKGSLAIKNAGTGGTSDIITVNSSSGVVLATLVNGQSIIVACDGTSIEAITTDYVPPVVLFSAVDKASNISVSADGKTASMASGSVGLVRATSTVIPAKAVFGFRVNSGAMSLGVATSAAPLTSGLGVNAFGWGYDSATGTKNYNGGGSAFGGTFGAGDVVLVYVNRAVGVIFWAKNGVLQGAGDPTTGDNPAFTGLPGGVFPAVGMIAGASVTLLITAAELGTTVSGYSTLG